VTNRMMGQDSPERPKGEKNRGQMFNRLGGLVKPPPPGVGSISKGGSPKGERVGGTSCVSHN